MSASRCRRAVSAATRSTIRSLGTPLWVFAARSLSITSPRARSSGPITIATGPFGVSASLSCFPTAWGASAYSTRMPASRSSCARASMGGRSSLPMAARNTSTVPAAAGASPRARSSSLSTTSPMPKPSAGRSTPPSAASRLS